MPSASNVAMHWALWEQQHGRIAPWCDSFWDWFEPSCMACGMPVFDIDPARPTFNTWDKTEGFLQRCHVVPRDMNGLDVEPNLVLMCKPCHASQPQSADPEDTWSYMRERTLMDRMIGSGYFTVRAGEIEPTTFGRKVHDGTVTA